MCAILKRVEFDATLDDVVDTNMRVAGRTKVFRRQRALYQWITGGFLAAVLIGTALAPSLSSPSPLGRGIVALMIAVGLAFGGLAGYGSRHYFDWRVRRHYRRMFQDVLHGASAMRFELELRQEGVWTRSRDVETSFPWSRLTRVADTPDAIELWFDPGLVVVRNRAFATDGERREFLDAARASGPRE